MAFTSRKRRMCAVLVLLAIAIYAGCASWYLGYVSIIIDNPPTATGPEYNSTETLSQVKRRVKLHCSACDKIVNPHPYTFSMGSHQPCKDPDLFLVVFIHSAPGYADRRKSIRQTWGNLEQYNESVALFFITGLPSDKSDQPLLQRENDVHGDIVQETFNDCYKNLTLKFIAGMRWVTENCRHAKFVLKTDDDCFVNMFGLLKHLHDLDQAQIVTNDLLMCNWFSNIAVSRTGKWPASHQDIPYDVYPDYCTGLAVVMTPNVAETLYVTSLYVPFFWIDDVYITGLLTHKIGLKITSVKQSFFNIVIAKPVLTSPRWYANIFAPISKPGYFERLWNILREQAKNNVIPAVREIKPGQLT